jgi:hypothetical protein
VSAQIEARRLSGVDIGRTVTVDDETTGVLIGVKHKNHVSTVLVIGADFADSHDLAPTDLVTIHDDRTTTPTPKETP